MTIKCMECSSSNICEDVARWIAQSLEPTDSGNEGELIEHQCRDCGRSFWLGADTATIRYLLSVSERFAVAPTTEKQPPKLTSEERDKMLNEATHSIAAKFAEYDIELIVDEEENRSRM
jgi:hypothetical protein